MACESREFRGLEGCTCPTCVFLGKTCRKLKWVDPSTQSKLQQKITSFSSTAQQRATNGDRRSEHRKSRFPTRWFRDGGGCRMLLVSQRRRVGVDTAWKRGFNGRLHQRRGQNRQTPLQLSRQYTLMVCMVCMMWILQMSAATTLEPRQQRGRTKAPWLPMPSSSSTEPPNRLPCDCCSTFCSVHRILYYEFSRIEASAPTGCHSPESYTGAAHMTIYIANAQARAWAQDAA